MDIIVAVLPQCIKKKLSDGKQTTTTSTRAKVKQEQDDRGIVLLFARRNQERYCWLKRQQTEQSSMSELATTP